MSKTRRQSARSERHRCRRLGPSQLRSSRDAKSLKTQERRLAPERHEIPRPQEARRAVFPDYHEEIQSIRIEREQVTVLDDIPGTQGHSQARSTGPVSLNRLRHIPFGEDVRFSVSHLFTVADGCITRWESMKTALALVAQSDLAWERVMADSPQAPAGLAATLTESWKVSAANLHHLEPTVASTT